MKNFTKQNFKTNPLWIRLLIMTFMVLLSTGSAWAGGDASGSIGVYLKVNGTSTWYKVYNPGSWGMSCSGYAFDSAKDIPSALGDITSGLSLEGLGIIGWTDSNNDWVAAKIAYTITPGSVSNSYQVGNYGSAGSGKANVQCTSGNNRVTAVKSSVDLISGLNPNDYTLKITPYAQMQWNNGSNSGTYNSYTRTAKSVTFTIPGYSTTTGSLAFGEVNIGSNSELSKSTTHYGSTTTATYEVSGTNASEFTVTACTATSVTVKFTPTSAGSKTATVKVTDAYGKTYTLTVTGTGKQACEAPTSVSITRGTPTTGNICQGSTIDLTATVDGSGDITYEWTKTSGGNDWTIANASAQKCTVTAGTGSATFQIKATRCSTSKTSTVTLTADPKSALTLKANPTICQGSSIVLSDYVQSSTGTVKWYSNPGMTTEITDPSVARTPQSSPTYYYARATSGVCSSVDKTLTVTLSPKPAIELTSSTATICNGDEITLANYVKSSTGTVKWYTNEGMTTEAAAKVKPTANTTYYAKATSGDCTAATAQLKVTVNNKPATPTLTPATVSLVSPETATLTAGNTTNGLTYTLYNGETAGESKKSTGGDLTFTVSAAGSYTVKVTNDCGTSTSTAVTVTVCTPQVNEFKHANSSYTKLDAQPTYYPGDKAYFVSIYTCCLTGSWSNNVNKGEEAWFAGLTGGTPKFSMTLTRAGNFTITNNATNGCTETQDVKVNLDFKVTALPEVTNTNGTASGADIALTWKHATSHTNVMVVRYPTSSTETIPAGGQAYTAGTTLGDGKVVYVGTAESFTDIHTF